MAQIDALEAALRNIDDLDLTVKEKVAAVKLIVTAVANILESPSDSRYKFIRCSNQSLRTKLMLNSEKGNYFESILFIVGFVREGGYYVMPNDADSEFLSQAWCALDSYKDSIEEAALHAHAPASPASSSEPLKVESPTTKQEEEKPSSLPGKCEVAASSAGAVSTSSSSNSSKERVAKEVQQMEDDLKSLRDEQRGRYIGSNRSTYTVRGSSSSYNEDEEGSSNYSNMITRFFGMRNSSSSSSSNRRPTSQNQGNRWNSGGSRIVTLKDVVPAQPSIGG